MDYTRWSAYTGDSERPEPPSQWRWVKDAAMVAVAGFFLGLSLGTWIATGVLSRLGVTIGGLALLVVGAVVGLGQLIDATRYDVRDLARISGIGLTVFGITTLASVIAHV